MNCSIGANSVWHFVALRDSDTRQQRSTASSGTVSIAFVRFAFESVPEVTADDVVKYGAAPVLRNEMQLALKQVTFRLTLRWQALTAAGRHRRLSHVAARWCPTLRIRKVNGAGGRNAADVDWRDGEVRLGWRLAAAKSAGKQFYASETRWWLLVRTQAVHGDGRRRATGERGSQRLVEDAAVAWPPPPKKRIRSRALRQSSVRYAAAGWRCAAPRFRREMNLCSEST